MTVTIQTKLFGTKSFDGVKSLTKFGGEYIIEYYTAFSYLEKYKLRQDDVLDITVNTISVTTSK